MKNTNKIVSIMLILVMIFTLASTTFINADDEPIPTTGKITINNAIVGQKYSIYSIFDLVSYHETQTSKTYAYKLSDSAWKDFFVGTQANEKAKEYFTIEKNDYVTFNAKLSCSDSSENHKHTASCYYSTETYESLTDADFAKFAKDALAYAKTKSIAIIAEQEATRTTVEFSNLPLGYYLVDSTTGALCSLDTTKTNASIQEKNSVPTLTKIISDATGTINDDNTKVIAQLGSDVKYTSTITVGKGAQNYEFTDSVDSNDSLIYNSGSLSVKIYDPDSSTEIANILDDTCYTSIINNEKVTVTFKDDFLNKLTGDETITLEYTAKLKDADMTPNGSEQDAVAKSSTATLKYGDDKSTLAVKTYVYSAQISVEKIYEYMASSYASLSGAEFVLKNSAGQYYKYDEENKVVSWETDINNATRHTSNTTTDNQPMVNVDPFMGLSDGTYTLVETTVPAGFNKAIDTEVIIEAKNYDLNNLEKKIQIENKQGILLPSTGGMGTTILYILGFILVIGAVVLLVSKKRTRMKD